MKDDVALGKRMADFGGKARDATEKDGWRPTGQQLFDAMTKDEQDAQFGPEIAQKLRDGAITLADLVKRDGGFITARPVSDL